MNENQFRRPVAVLSNRKMTLDVPFLPAKLGRNENAVDMYLFHESISREHCIFECYDGSYTLRDLGSTAGTYINGARLDPNVAYKVEDGDKLKIGKVKLVFRADYEALAVSQQLQAQEAMQAEAAREQARREQEAPREKRITVAARELNEFEYDESEVVMIDCGLTEYAGPMSYTNRIRKEDIEKAQKEAEAAEAAEAEAEEAAEAVQEPEEEAYEELAQAAAEEIPGADDAPEAGMKATLVMDPAEPEEDEDDEAGSYEDEETTDLGQSNGPAVLRISWVDEETGENRSLSIEIFPFSIGRKSDENDFAFRKKGMSRKHFHFDMKDGRFTVCDDDSTNGVKVNGKRIAAGEDVAIKEGDSIRAAGITFAVRIDS